MAVSAVKPFAGSAIVGGYVLSYLMAAHETTDFDEEPKISKMGKVVTKAADAISSNPRLYFVVATLGYVAFALRG